MHRIIGRLVAMRGLWPHALCSVTLPSVSFAGVKPGKYDYICQPHLANNMKGSITVQ